MFPTRARRRAASLGSAAMLTIAGTGALSAHAGASSPAGIFTVTPAAGTTDGTEDIVLGTSTACPAPATHYSLTVSGAGFPDGVRAANALSDGPGNAGGSVSIPTVSIPLGTTWNGVGTVHGVALPLTGTATLTLACTDDFGVEEFGHFTGEVLFTPTEGTSATYTSLPDPPSEAEPGGGAQPEGAPAEGDSDGEKTPEPEVGSDGGVDAGAGEPVSDPGPGPGEDEGPASDGLVAPARADEAGPGEVVLFGAAALPDPEPEAGSGQQAIVVTVPEITEGEFAWSISGGSRTVVLRRPTNEGTYLRSIGGIRAVEVSDTRTGGPPWAISGQVGAFTGPSPMPGAYLGWTPMVNSWGAGAEPGAPVAPSPAGGAGLSVPAVLASSPGGHAAGTASLGAALDLHLPLDTPPGTYTTTLTITALS